MLRLGLIENVRRMALRTVQRLDEIEAADKAAAAARRCGPREQRRARRGARGRSPPRPPPLTPAFVSRFLHQLRVEGARAAGRRAARAVDRRGGAERGGGHGARHPAARAHADRDGQQHHQPARHRPDGLAHLRRAPEPDGGGAARGPVGVLPPDDVRHPRPLPPRGRADRQAHPAERRERGPARGRAARALGAGPRAGGPARRATSATTSSTTGWPSSSGSPATGRRPARRSTAGCCATRTPSSSAASLGATLAAPWPRCCWLGGTDGAGRRGSRCCCWA